MRFHTTIAAALLTLTLSACGKPAPAGTPVQVEASEVEPKIFWSSDLSRRRVSIDGFINFDNGPNGQAIAMRPELTSSPGGTGRPLIGFEAAQGSGPNQLDLHPIRTEHFAAVPAAPATIVFDMAAATYQDAAGATHHFDERVRVTGRLEYVRVENLGLLTDPDPRSPNGRRFKPMLVDVTFEAVR